MFTFSFPLLAMQAWLIIYLLERAGREGCQRGSKRGIHGELTHAHTNTHTRKDNAKTNSTHGDSHNTHGVPRAPYLFCKCHGLTTGYK